MDKHFYLSIPYPHPPPLPVISISPSLPSNLRIYLIFKKMEREKENA
jgi:hypothetical protein